jgi:hypothetical protein
MQFALLADRVKVSFPADAEDMEDVHTVHACEEASPIIEEATPDEVADPMPFVVEDVDDLPYNTSADPDLQSAATHSDTKTSDPPSSLSGADPGATTLALKEGSTRGADFQDSVRADELLEASSRDPFDIPDPIRLSAANFDAAKKEVVDLPPVTMDQLSNGYAYRDALLEEDLAPSRQAFEDKFIRSSSPTSPVIVPPSVPDDISPSSEPAVEHGHPTVPMEEASPIYLDGSAAPLTSNGIEEPAHDLVEDDDASDDETASHIESQLRPPPSSVKSASQEEKIAEVTTKAARRRSSRLSAMRTSSPPLTPSSRKRRQTSVSSMSSAGLQDSLPGPKNRKVESSEGDMGPHIVLGSPSSKRGTRRRVASPEPMQEVEPETPPSIRAQRAAAREVSRPKVHAHGKNHTILVPADTPRTPNGSSGHLPVTRSQCTFRKVCPGLRPCHLLMSGQIAMPSPRFPNETYHILVPTRDPSGHQAVDLGRRGRNSAGSHRWLGAASRLRGPAGGRIFGRQEAEARTSTCRA